MATVGGGEGEVEGEEERFMGEGEGELLLLLATSHNTHYKVHVCNISTELSFFIQMFQVLRGQVILSKPLSTPLHFQRGRSTSLTKVN